MLAKLQTDLNILTPNLAASRLRGIWRYDVLPLGEKRLRTREFGVLQWEKMPHKWRCLPVAKAETWDNIPETEPLPAEGGIKYPLFVHSYCFPVSNVSPVSVVLLDKQQLQSSRLLLTEVFALGYSYEYRYSKQKAPRYLCNPHGSENICHC